MDLGYATTIRHKIETGDAPPLRERHRKIPPQMFQQVKSHIKDLLKQGVITESHSPWAAPIVLVKKKDDSIRLCVDYRKLNAKTRRDAHPLPRIEESLEALGRAKYFSTLDLASGYWQIAMDPQDQEKTAFTTPMGPYEFTRLPFGLMNGPATFQRYMETCLGDLHYESILIYIDDIVIFSEDCESHLERLEMVFERLEKHGLKLKPSKCHLFQEQISYLGHVVSAKGVATDPDKCKTVINWKVPRSVTELRTFMGLAGYYRRFVKDFSKIAAPLYELIGTANVPKKGKRSDQQGKKQKKEPYKWTEKHQQAFDAIKVALTSPPILAFPDYSKPFIVYTDASSNGLGAVLSQVQDGKEHVIAYASRTLRPAEKNDGNYSSFKIELQALTWAITEKFKGYLSGSKFTAYTDHNPLVHLSTAQLNATEQRWVARLANYDFDIVYRSGKSNGNADALSRKPDQEVLTCNVIKACCAIFSSDNFVEGAEEKMGERILPGLTKEELLRKQKLDEDIEPVRQCVKQGTKPNQEDMTSWSSTARRLCKEWKKLRLEDEVLYRAIHDNIEPEPIYQLVLPKEMKTDIFTELHNKAGHFGNEKTYSMIRQRFYWPEMKADIQDWCKQCERCALRKVTGPTTKEPLVKIKTSAPLQILAVDFLTIERSTSGYEYVLVMTDLFTKFAVAIPTRDMTAKTTAQTLWRHFIQIFGCPARILSDQDQILNQTQSRNFVDYTA